MIRNSIVNEYFEWLYSLVCKKRYSKDISYRKLLMCLHDITFEYTIPKDKNRADDGVDLRWRFAISKPSKYSPEFVLDVLDAPCSVLEMMIALSIRCEETIMDDPTIGDRTDQWFWDMIKNMGLGKMTDENFNRRYVEEIVGRFLNRDYGPDGRGGLFRIDGCDQDLRRVEIWYQLCWYLDTIV